MSYEPWDPEQTIENLRALLAGVSGVEKYEIFVRKVGELEIRAKNQNLSELRDEYLCEASLRLQKGSNCIVAASSDLSDHGLKSLIANARSLLRGAQVGPTKRIIAPDSVPIGMEYDGCFADVPVDEKVSRVLNMCASIVKHSARYPKDVKSTYFEQKVEEWMWTSGGRSLLKHKSMWGKIAARSLLEKTEASMGFVSSELKTQYFDLDWAGVAKSAGEGASLIDESRTPKSGTFKAIVEAPVAMAMLELFSKALRGDRVLNGRSFLGIEDLEKPLFSSVLNLVDDPERSSRSGYRFWDAEGGLTSKKVFIEDGRLLAFAFDNSAGCSEGYESNMQAIRPRLSAHPHPGFHSLSIVPVNKDLIDLKREMDEGLWLRNLDSLSMLQPGSGEYIASFSGGWLSKGELQHGLTRIIVRGDLKTFFSKIVSVGRDMAWGEHFGAPSLLLSEIEVLGS